MSASAMTTIWCDGCGAWEHTGSNAAEARRYAKRDGWAVALPSLDAPPDDNPTGASLWLPGQRRDLCPDCRSEGVS